ncbi:alpha/beta hydrolase [Massilia sp. METH4]|uniref:alpha/beta fold hydrolase n=1 Tax=Massilia sp. METH4 TaxID=3123041 RepID=UPI0030CCA251
MKAFLYAGLTAGILVTPACSTLQPVAGSTVGSAVDDSRSFAPIRDNIPALNIPTASERQAQDAVDATRYYPAQAMWSDEPEFTPAAEGYVRGDGASLWYQDSGGAGVPIVLLHASTGSGASWRHQQAYFSQKGYRVIVYSRRGHFRSTVDSPAAQASDTADLLAVARHLQLPAFHLLGTAAGGFTAMDFALRHPDQLRSLIIASSLGGVDTPEFVAATARLLVPEFLALPSHIKELGPAYRALNPGGTQRWIALEELARQGVPRRPTMENRIDERALRRLQPPTLFLTGGADLYVPPALFALLRPHVRNASYAVIAEAGHAAAWEQPAAFNSAVLSFIAQH